MVTATPALPHYPLPVLSSPDLIPPSLHALLLFTSSSFYSSFPFAKMPHSCFSRCPFFAQTVLGVLNHKRRCPHRFALQLVFSSQAQASPSFFPPAPRGTSQAPLHLLSQPPPTHAPMTSPSSTKVPTFTASALSRSTHKTPPASPGALAFSHPSSPFLLYTPAPPATSNNFFSTTLPSLPPSANAKPMSSFLFSPTLPSRVSHFETPSHPENGARIFTHLFQTNEVASPASPPSSSQTCSTASLLPSS